MAVDAVALGAAAVMKGADVFAQAKMNKKTRKFAEGMYNKQRADNLADWHMQNEYNDPSAVMARMRKAGLNENLPFGSGTDSQSGPVKSADAPSWNPETPQFSSALSSFQDYQMREAQTNNLRAQNTVLTQDAILKAAQVENTAAQTDASRFNIGQASRLADTSFEVLKEELRGKQIANTVALDRNEREIALNASNLKEAAERILVSRSQRATTEADRERIRAQIKNIDKDTQLKQLDINLKEKGIQPGDPLYMRALGQFLESSAGKKATETAKKAMDAVPPNMSGEDKQLGKWKWGKK